MRTPSEMGQPWEPATPPKVTHSQVGVCMLCRFSTSQKVERVAQELCCAARFFAVILFFLSLSLGSLSSQCQMPP